MIVSKLLASSWFSRGVLVVLACFSAMPPRVEAQSQCPTPSAGFNAVYGNCTTSPGQQGTFAMVDASQYANSTTDICIAIQNIFIQYQHQKSNGVVVDARGVNLAQTPACSVNPWDITKFSFGEPDNSIVLLPAGTISIPVTWTLPANARIVGLGPNLTMLQASSGLNTAMIEMGTSKLCSAAMNDCPDVQIEHLGLVGNNKSGFIGILNQYAQELSEVNDVSFTNFMEGTALVVETINAVNSGPYSNLTMSNVGTCVDINNTYGTRGIHGLNCTLTASSTAGMLVDGANNSVENVFIQGSSSQDGILVASRYAAQSNLLFNVTGSGLKNVVELSVNASDITVVGVTSLTSAATIADDLPGGRSITDENVGMYVLGEAVQDNTSGNPVVIGYSRLTTSTSTDAVTWLVGPNSPTGTGCSVGSLFSCNSSNAKTCAQGVTLWGCGTTGGSTGWYPIK
jgi:hypothetical protein